MDKLAGNVINKRVIRYNLIKISLFLRHIKMKNCLLGFVPQTCFLSLAITFVDNALIPLV